MVRIRCLSVEYKEAKKLKIHNTILNNDISNAIRNLVKLKTNIGEITPVSAAYAKNTKSITLKAQNWIVTNNLFETIILNLFAWFCDLNN